MNESGKVNLFQLNADDREVNRNFNLNDSFLSRFKHALLFPLPIIDILFVLFCAVGFPWRVWWIILRTEGSFPVALYFIFSRAPFC